MIIFAILYCYVASHVAAFFSDMYKPNKCALIGVLWPILLIAAFLIYFET